MHLAGIVNKRYAGMPRTRINKAGRRWGRCTKRLPTVRAAKIRNRQVHINIKSGAEIPVWGIVGQIRQILARLVSNALDAASVGGNVWLAGRTTTK